MLNLLSYTVQVIYQFSYLFKSLLIALFCAPGSSPPLVLDGQDLRLVSVKLNGKALKVYISIVCVYVYMYFFFSTWLLYELNHQLSFIAILQVFQTMKFILLQLILILCVMNVTFMLHS